MIVFILYALVPTALEDITEIMSLETFVLAPIFFIIGIICMICWLKDRRTTKKNGRKLIEKIEEIEKNNINNILGGW